eukprot:TRINITY_DN21675_c0_g1_i1.p1 TRINITY_DN21675_c0_g1~~TRINITY_DN21675_c0_g1_i1.p1  ORF type:complete len:469 (+),score=93.46 TRINITY_DN21675_c0_g1_i1:129-1535(+)
MLRLSGDSLLSGTESAGGYRVARPDMGAGLSADSGPERKDSSSWSPPRGVGGPASSAAGASWTYAADVERHTDCPHDDLEEAQTSTVEQAALQQAAAKSFASRMSVRPEASQSRGRGGRRAQQTPELQMRDIVPDRAFQKNFTAFMYRMFSQSKQNEQSQLQGLKEPLMEGDNGVPQGGLDAFNETWKMQNDKIEENKKEHQNEIQKMNKELWAHRVVLFILALVFVWLHTSIGNVDSTARMSLGVDKGQLDNEMHNQFSQLQVVQSQVAVLQTQTEHLRSQLSEFKTDSFKEGSSLEHLQGGLEALEDRMKSSETSVTKLHDTVHALQGFATAETTDLKHNLAATEQSQSSEFHLVRKDVKELQSRMQANEMSLTTLQGSSDTGLSKLQKALEDQKRADEAALAGVIFVKSVNHDCPIGSFVCACWHWFNPDNMDPHCGGGAVDSADGRCYQEGSVWKAELTCCCRA